uniref:Uncharacterized protein n=1 Tax=Mycena chlorophos TaxID=658473 RepID=A0ABQ0LKC9_MYCCL|nr:predicted protein [Mycena chlorophos]
MTKVARYASVLASLTPRQVHIMLTTSNWSATKVKTVARNSKKTAKLFNFAQFFPRIGGQFEDPSQAKRAEEMLDFPKHAVFGDAVDPLLLPQTTTPAVAFGALGAAATSAN